MKSLFKNWKTTGLGLMFAVATLFVVLRQISLHEWAAICGVIGTFGAFMLKDPEK